MLKPFGAVPCETGVRIRVPAPEVRELSLVLHDGGAAGRYPLRDREGDGTFDVVIEGAAAGDRYGFSLDGGPLRPDPASRFQPEGVHGPSEIVDPGTFAWTDREWRGVAPRDLVLYELHVGAFSPEGTFAGARHRLPLLRDLGVTGVELMPVADFPGARNWGYDGVCLFAPSRAYGRPEDLRAFVDTAHALGIAVFLDVVYNHLGPEGAYVPAFLPRYHTDRHRTPWGAAVNVDGPGSEIVREFILASAVHWIREYHLDGLRLDATHALVDDSPTHIVKEIAAAVRGAHDRARIHAEDHRNLAAMLEDVSEDGWGLDAVWADDFHHILRIRLAGDRHGYYADFDGAAEELARTIRQGWLFTGQRSRHLDVPRGTDPSRIPMQRFVVCLQNHDQIGNRATGDRLHHAIDAAAWRAVSVLLLTVPMTPLLFMGQEWAASTPFQFFTDFEPGLGAGVTEGRRLEFAAFPEFSDADARLRIPDPQAASTFDASRLRWEERERAGHRESLALYRAVLALRRRHDALRASSACAGEAETADDDSIVVRRRGEGETFWVIVRLTSGGTVEVPLPPGAQIVLTTEDEGFAPDPQPPAIEWRPDGARVVFHRAGAVILRRAVENGTAMNAGIQ
jgi:maltooligosyltrehalose trehalohydrolase